MLCRNYVPINAAWPTVQVIVMSVLTSLALDLKLAIQCPRMASHSVPLKRTMNPLHLLTRHEHGVAFGAEHTRLSHVQVRCFLFMSPSECTDDIQCHHS